MVQCGAVQCSVVPQSDRLERYDVAHVAYATRGSCCICNTTCRMQHNMSCATQERYDVAHVAYRHTAQ